MFDSQSGFGGGGAPRQMGGNNMTRSYQVCRAIKTYS